MYKLPYIYIYIYIYIWPRPRNPRQNLSQIQNVVQVHWTGYRVVKSDVFLNFALQKRGGTDAFSHRNQSNSLKNTALTKIDFQETWGHRCFLAADMVSLLSKTEVLTSQGARICREFYTFVQKSDQGSRGGLGGPGPQIGTP